MTSGKVSKKCDKCGHVSKVRPRDRRCKRIEVTGFRRRVYCWGNLQRIERKRVEETLELKLAAAHKGFGAAISRMKRATTWVGTWQRRIKGIERRIDERDHPKPPKPKRVRKVRAIVVEGT